MPDTTVSGFASMPKASWSLYLPSNRLLVPVESMEFSTTITQSAGVATGTTSIDHGFEVGDLITISGANEYQYNVIEEVTSVPSSTTFTYAVDSTVASPATGTIIATVAVRDRFIVSDIYDISTYDPVYNQFRINRGSADYLIGAVPFQKDDVIILYRRSIHVITNIGTSSLLDLTGIFSQRFLITEEAGCIARKSAVVIGPHLYFLSDKGVYRILITPEINLRGQDVPLSKDIEDQIFAINWDYADKAVGTYYNNKYYLAVPSATSTRNDIIFVYNLLNQKWESIDSYAGGNNYADDFVIANKDGKQRLLSTSVEGAVQLLEELDHDELGTIGGGVSNAEIAGQLITRRYTLGSATMLNPRDFSALENNKFMRSSINFESLSGDAFTVTATTENPDASSVIATYTRLSAEDYHKRPRINKRGTGCELQFDTTAGRSAIRSTSVEGIELQRANKNFS